LFPQQLAHQLDGRSTVSPALKQHVEDLAFVVDRAPEIYPLAGDPDHHLVVYRAQSPQHAAGRLTRTKVRNQR
jgi:hypothetical protein